MVLFQSKTKRFISQYAIANHPEPDNTSRTGTTTGRPMCVSTTITYRYIVDWHGSMQVRIFTICRSWGLRWIDMTTAAKQVSLGRVPIDGHTYTHTHKCEFTYYFTFRHTRAHSRTHKCPSHIPFCARWTKLKYVQWSLLDRCVYMGPV